MPTYVYEALNDAGKPEKGTIVAANSEDAIARIRSKGHFPTSVREQKVRKKSSGSGGSSSKGKSGGKKSMNEITITIGGVSKKHLTNFTRQLSTLQDAGLPILRSIQILQEQQKPGLLKNSLRGVYDDVSGGATLSDAMAKYPKAFDKLYTKMIAAGEVGGVLDLILQRLAEFMEKAAKLKKKIIGAMIYPAVVVSVAALIVVGIMIIIVPKFEKIFEDFDTDLPTVTTMLMQGSRWLGGSRPGQIIPGAVYLVFTPFLAFFGIKLLRKTGSGKLIIDRMFLLIPVAGKLIAKSTIARFTRTLGTLINAGVPILDALIITRDTTGNEIYRRALTSVHDSVRKGDSFAEPLRKSRVCDGLVVNMIDVGEETGDLDKMLLKIADNYDEEVDVMVEALVSLLEPIMVVVLGGIVGFIVIALFMPLVKLITNLS
ncbi:MAG TPA: pilus assembly protein PilC [Phycisphaerales bacterium]|nr:pilus assembly protein PilC [Phycisphaerales bacterium]|tara:strand:+ start:496 stop:1785 length:1290 start_codon:yes stop_codon:yes gene_type:complete